MKLSEAFPSNFIKADDLGGKDVTVTISGIELESLGQQEKEKKLLISFLGKDKKLVCNKTNARTIEKVLESDDTSDWIGKKIILGPREVEFAGEMVWAIRVSLKNPNVAPAQHGTNKPVKPVTKPTPEPEPMQEPQIDPNDLGGVPF